MLTLEELAVPSKIRRLANAAYSLAAVAFVILAKKRGLHASLDALELASLIDRTHEVSTALYYILKEESWQDDDEWDDEEDQLVPLQAE